MGRPTADAINRARTETQGYLDHCHKQLAEGIDVKATHIAKLEAILAGLDALDRVAVLEAQLAERKHRTFLLPPHAPSAAGVAARWEQAVECDLGVDEALSYQDVCVLVEGFRQLEALLAQRSALLTDLGFEDAADELDVSGFDVTLARIDAGEFGEVQS